MPLSSGPLAPARVRRELPALGDPLPLAAAGSPRLRSALGPRWCSGRRRSPRPRLRRIPRRVDRRCGSRFRPDSSSARHRRGRRSERGLHRRRMRCDRELPPDASRPVARLRAGRRRRSLADRSHELGHAAATSWRPCMIATLPCSGGARTNRRPCPERTVDALLLGRDLHLGPPRRPVAVHRFMATARPAPLEIVVVHGGPSKDMEQRLQALIGGTGVAFAICACRLRSSASGTSASTGARRRCLLRRRRRRVLWGYAAAVLAVYQADRERGSGGVQGTIANPGNPLATRSRLANIFLLTRLNGDGTFRLSGWPAFCTARPALARVDVFSGPAMSFRREVPRSTGSTRRSRRLRRGRFRVGVPGVARLPAVRDARRAGDALLVAAVGAGG